MKMTSHQRERIQKAVERTIDRAKADRTACEKNLLAIMERQNSLENKTKDASGFYDYDIKSTQYLIDELMDYIEGYLED